MYWWARREGSRLLASCLLVAGSGDLDSTARVYRGSFREYRVLNLTTGRATTIELTSNKILQWGRKQVERRKFKRDRKEKEERKGKRGKMEAA